MTSNFTLPCLEETRNSYFCVARHKGKEGGGRGGGYPIKDKNRQRGEGVHANSDITNNKKLCTFLFFA